MKKFYVEIPINGVICVNVEAEDEKDAILKAINECDVNIESTSERGYSLEEWNLYNKLAEGNCWYGISYEAFAEEDSH